MSEDDGGIVNVSDPKEALLVGDEGTKVIFNILFKDKTMDTRNGAVFTPEEIEQMKKIPEAFTERLKHLKEMKLPLTRPQRKQMKIGRNDSCPCGSGRKFKKCCLVQP